MAANAPITVKVALTLGSVGINPQFIKFTHVTMESEKFICVRETSPSNSVVMIDMNMPMQPLRRPITADSALMNPNTTILALKAQVPGTTQDHLQVFNIETRTKMKSYQMNQQVVFWKWITPKLLGIVTQSSVYHWSIEGDCEPVKVFDRTANLANNQIINYRCDPTENWLVLIGIAPGSPERPQLVKGNMQLFALDQQRSQALEAHAASFASFRVTGNDKDSILICFASKTINAGQVTSKMHVIELGAQPGKPSFTKKQADMFFPPDFADDFPVSMQISNKYGLIYVITKLGLLFVYDMETATAVYRNRISRDPIFLTAEASSVGGFYAVNRRGQVLLATVNEAIIVPFVSGQSNNLELAVNLAKRGNLPGAEELVAQRFRELFAHTKYKEAAELAAESPRGILRTPDTVAKFQSVPVQAGQTPPLLQYFGTLLTRGKLNAFESLELSRLVVNQNKKNLLENWLVEDKLEFSEELGDLVKTIDNDLALKIYIKARATPKVVAAFAERREFYSKQALRRNDAEDKFQQITERFEAALSDISNNKLEISLSEEVQEQIELVHAQFKRAKSQTEFADLQLDLDIAVAHKEKDPDPVILKRLSEKLHLRTINDLKKESSELHELVITSYGEPGDRFEAVSLLTKLKDCMLTENSKVASYESEQVSTKHWSPVIPDDFRCPISLELMKDPVIVSTGQTYERSCIQKWLDAGHRTCPKTQQTLLHTALTPNYVLKSLIGLWCESNGVELPKKQGSCKTKKSGTSLSDCDRTAIKALLDKLTSNDIEQQRAAAGEFRFLAKRNADNRVCIAEAGAIPLLVELLSSTDPRTQEHAVTALLNLSINESNKGTIVNAGAIPDIVDVLKNGSMEARENAAATLFSLSVLDENKVAIGAAGAIPALIKLLCEGTPRGKKDAATAIFNLCIYQGNKARAAKAGIVAALIRFMKDAVGGMVDEALAVMAILASHHEGKIAISQAEPIPILVEVIRTGSPRNRENAAAVLWSVCTGDFLQLKLAKEHGAVEALQGLSENGTDRAKRKAASILELLQRIEGEDSSNIDWILYCAETS